MSYRIAAVDVHKKMLALVVADVEGEGEYEFERRKFGATPAELHLMAAWMVQQEVEEIVMESTAQYWKPVWYGLEPQMRLQLAQAYSNRAPRGRKHDFKDAERLIRRLVANVPTAAVGIFAVLSLPVHAFSDVPGEVACPTIEHPT